MNHAVHAGSERNSAVELLRIFAMLFIVMSHCSVHGGFPDDTSMIPINSYFLDWISLGNLGVDLFLMISGFFLSTREFKIQWIIKRLAQVLFFSYFCLGVSWLAGNTITKKALLKAVFPTINSEYWFFSAYVVLLLLSPYINAFIRNSSRKQLFSCVSVMLALWCVLPAFTEVSMYGTELPQFVMFYLMGACLQKYPDNVLSSRKFRIWLIVCCAILLFASSAALRFRNGRVSASYIFERKHYGRTSVLIVGLAIGIFAAAVHHKPWSNPLVNTVSACTFGVYLLHDNPLIRTTLWTMWINNDAFYDSDMFILRILFSVAAVYAVCTLIEFLRQKFFARPMEYLLEKAYDICSRGVKRSVTALQTARRH